MQRYTVNLFLETALHVSRGISTHHQEHIQVYLQHIAISTHHQEHMQLYLQHLVLVKP